MVKPTMASSNHQHDSNIWVPMPSNFITNFEGYNSTNHFSTLCSTSFCRSIVVCKKRKIKRKPKKMYSNIIVYSNIIQDSRLHFLSPVNADTSAGFEKKKNSEGKRTIEWCWARAFSICREINTIFYLIFDLNRSLFPSWSNCSNCNGWNWFECALNLKNWKTLNSNHLLKFVYGQCNTKNVCVFSNLYASMCVVRAIDHFWNPSKITFDKQIKSRDRLNQLSIVHLFLLLFCKRSQ